MQNAMCDQGFVEELNKCFRSRGLQTNEAEAVLSLYEDGETWRITSDAEVTAALCSILNHKKPCLLIVEERSTGFTEHGLVSFLRVAVRTACGLHLRLYKSFYYPTDANKKRDTSIAHILQDMNQE